MIKFYYYMYFRIYNSARKISDDVINEIKPGATIILLELFIIAQVSLWLQLFKHISTNLQSVLWSIPVLITELVLLIFFNYFVFLHKDKWKRYNNEFRKYPKNKKCLLDLMIIIVFIGVVSGFIVSYYMWYKK